MTDSNSQISGNARQQIDLNRFQDWWSLVSASVLAAAGLCFASGLLIVNIRLAKFGVYAPSLVRSEYVLAGAAYLFLTGVTLASAHLTLKRLANARNMWREHRRALATAEIVAVSFVGVSIPGWALYILSDYQLNWMSWPGLGSVAILAGNALGLYEFQLEYQAWSRRASTESVMVPQALVQTVVDFLTRQPVPMVILGITLYATVTYPLLSSAFGGGRRDPLLLLVTPEGARVSMQLGLPVSINNEIVGPVEPITETNDELILAARITQGHFEDANAIRFRRSLFVAAVNVHNRKPREP